MCPLSHNRSLSADVLPVPQGISAVAFTAPQHISLRQCVPCPITHLSPQLCSRPHNTPLTAEVSPAPQEISLRSCVHCPTAHLSPQMCLLYNNISLHRCVPWPTRDLSPPMCPLPYKRSLSAEVSSPLQQFFPERNTSSNTIHLSPCPTTRLPS